MILRIVIAYFTFDNNKRDNKDFGFLAPYTIHSLFFGRVYDSPHVSL